jgi:hypothetical protein
LSWTAPVSDGGAALTDYTVEYSSDSGTTWTTFTDGTSTTASTTVTGLSNGTTYTFRVSAVTAAGTGAVSDSASATTLSEPDPPTSLSATAGIEQVALTWTAPSSNGGSAITDYTIEYSSDSGTTWTTFADGTSTATSATVTGLSTGTTYTFKVAAVNAAGTGTPSATVSATTVNTPGPPTTLTAMTGNTKMYLSWAAPSSDGGATVTDYTVEYATPGAGAWTTFADGISTTTSTTVTGLSNDTTYLFRVSAISDAGTGTPSDTATSTPVSPTLQDATIDARNGAELRRPSVAIASNGYPIISSSVADGLNVTRCGDAACNISTSGLHSGAGPVLDTAIAIGDDDNPIIAYYDSDDLDLRVSYCQDPQCDSHNYNTVDATGDVGQYPSIVIGNDGNPVIAYYDSTNKDAKIAACSDTQCASATITTLEGGYDTGGYMSLAIGNDGNPVVSYYQSTYGQIRVAICSTSTCSASTITSLEMGTGLGQYMAVAIGEDGNPVIAYYDTYAENRKLMIAICVDTSCISASTQTLAETYLFAKVSVVIDDGTPLVAYKDPGDLSGDDRIGTLKVAKCIDSACTTVFVNDVDEVNGEGNPTGNPGGISMVVGDDGKPVIAYSELLYSQYPLKFAVINWH